MRKAPRYALAEVAVWEKGTKPLATFSDPPAHGVPYLTASCLRTGEVQEWVVLQPHDAGAAPTTPSAAVLWDGSSAGDVFVNLPPGLLASTMVGVAPAHDALDHGYLGLAIQAHASVLKATSRGSGIPHVDPQVFGSLPIVVPPLSAQKRVVGIINAADALISTLSSLAAHNERLTDALAASSVEALRDSPIRPLGDVADIRGGITKGRKTTGPTRPVPMLRAANVHTGFIDTADMVTIEATDAEVERLRLNTGDVLIVEGSGNHARIGTGWMWDGSIPECLCQNHVFRIRPNTSELMPGFLAHYLTTSGARNYFRLCVKSTSGLGTINRTEVAALPVPVPALDDQARAVTLLDQARRTAAQVRSEHRAAVQTRHSLLAELMDGYVVRCSASMAGDADHSAL